MASSDDDELQAAIVLSLQSSSSPPKSLEPRKASATVVDLTSDDDAVDNLGINSSTSPLSNDHRCPTHSRVEHEALDDNSHSRKLGMLGLDRMRMEAERLARKRKLSMPPPSLTRQLPQRRVESKDSLISTSRTSTGIVKRLEAYSSASSPLHAHSRPTERILDYPEGVVKQTWAFGYPRDGDIKIEEVLQNGTLQMAVLSSFQWDMNWLLSKIPLGSTDIIFVMQAKEDAVKRQYLSETATMPRIRLCFPPMDGQVNCMHSKLMLLFYPSHLRICVPSGNLTPYDWGEQNGVLENTVFLIDLPRLERTPGTDENSIPFFDDMIHFIKAMGLQEDVILQLSHFDFSKTKHLAFVHSIGGSHLEKAAWERTGHCGLGRAVSSLGLQTANSIEVDFVTSSVGCLNYEFLQSIYQACQGDNGLLAYKSRTSQHGGRGAKPQEPKPTLSQGWREKFRIYYPSKVTVLESKGGPQSAGTICFQSKWFNNASFPRDCMRDCLSVRHGMLMHNKMLFVRFEDAAQARDGPRCVGWLYTGSANLSESAWGRLVLDSASKQPKLNCRNWECGVVVPLMDKARTEAATPGLRRPPGPVEIEAFGSVVPFKKVAEQSGSRRSYRPWYHTEV